MTLSKNMVSKSFVKNASESERLNSAKYVRKPLAEMNVKADCGLKKGQQWDWGNRNVFELCLGGNNIAGSGDWKVKKESKMLLKFPSLPQRGWCLFH